MPITRLPEAPKVSRPFTLDLNETAKPLAMASAKIWQTNPEQFLSLAITALLIILTFLGELLSSLPWGWYLALCVWIINQSIPLISLKKKKKSNAGKRNTTTQETGRRGISSGKTSH